MSLEESTEKKFIILRELASGGYADVYLARQRDLDREVAVKVLRSEDEKSAEDRSRFVAEARITAALSHPHIVQVLDFGASGKKLWIAYEYIPGETLEQKLRKGPMIWREAVDVILQVARALEEAHSKGIIHRDIKPENVIEVGSGQYKVADFGIAKWSGKTGIKTSHGLLVGTPAYMAPERIQGAEPTPLFDVYALGVMLHELIAGRQPFRGKVLYEVLRAHLEQAPPLLRQFSPDAPESLERLILRTLEKDPERRLASMRIFRESLEAIARDQVPESPKLDETTAIPSPVGAPSRRRQSSMATVSMEQPPLPSRTRHHDRKSHYMGLIGVMGSLLLGILLWIQQGRIPAPARADSPPPAPVPFELQLPAALEKRLSGAIEPAISRLQGRMLTWTQRLGSMDSLLANHASVDSSEFMDEVKDMKVFQESLDQLEALEKQADEGARVSLAIDLLRLRLQCFLFATQRNMVLGLEAASALNNQQLTTELDEQMKSSLGRTFTARELERRSLTHLSNSLELWPSTLDRVIADPGKGTHLGQMMHELYLLMNVHARSVWSEGAEATVKERIKRLLVQLEGPAGGEGSRGAARRLARSLIAFKDLNGRPGNDEPIYAEISRRLDELVTTVPQARIPLGEVRDIIMPRAPVPVTDVTPAGQGRLDGREGP